MTPIEKNVAVIDEFGRRYEATYPKRAKGLVKKGRARFIDEHTICLACPPEFILEDDEMSEYIDIPEITEDIAEEVNAEPVRETAPNDEGKITVREILERMDRIIEDSAHIHRALDAIIAEENAPHSNRALGLGNIVEAREKTNQRMIEFLNRLYNDISPRNQFKEQIVKESLKEHVRPHGPGPWSAGQWNWNVPKNSGSALKEVLEEVKGIDWKGIDSEVKEILAEAIAERIRDI